MCTGSLLLLWCGSRLTPCVFKRDAVGALCTDLPIVSAGVIKIPKGCVCHAINLLCACDGQVCLENWCCCCLSFNRVPTAIQYDKGSICMICSAAVQAHLSDVRWHAARPVVRTAAQQSGYLVRTALWSGLRLGEQSVSSNVTCITQRSYFEKFCSYDEHLLLTLHAMAFAFRLSCCALFSLELGTMPNMYTFQWPVSYNPEYMLISRLQQ